MSICLLAYKGGFVVQCCIGGTPVQGQNSNISYDVPKPVIIYLLFNQLPVNQSLMHIRIMAALCSRCGHYIFALWFLLSFLD